MIKVSVMYANTPLRLSEGLWRKFWRELRIAVDSSVQNQAASVTDNLGVL
jgi:hypothetical protein